MHSVVSRPTGLATLLLALLAPACGDKAEEPGPATTDDTAAGTGGDTDSGGGGDDTGEELEPVDSDGDGFPRWDTTHDPAEADCDDDDPDVTPATERLVPAGAFWRGSEQWPNAQPVAEVTLSAYCMDVYEVTHADFVPLLERAMEEHGATVDDQGRELYDFADDDDIYELHIHREAEGFSVDADYADHPVVEVYYWSAEAYCGWEGKQVPTEAQWEKAARGDADQRDWPWDGEIDCSHANYLYAGDPGPDAEPCVGDTLPVGSLPDGASPYGIHDLAGNVGEWVRDWFQEDYYSSGELVDPQGPDEGEVTGEGWTARLSRGGNHATRPLETQVAHRQPEPETASSNGVGFRCVREL